MEKSKIQEIRKQLIDALKDYEGEPLLLEDVSPEILREIVFDINTCLYETSCRFNDELVRNGVLEKIDFSNISFDGIEIEHCCCFRGLKGVKINPQTVYSKNLKYGRFEGVEFIGPFDGCNIEYVDFTDSTGAVINPQTILKKSLVGTKLSGVTFNGSFDDCKISNVNFNVWCAPPPLNTLESVDFTGSKGAIINPVKLYGRNLRYAKLSGVTFEGSFCSCKIEGANFENSKGAVININDLYHDIESYRGADEGLNFYRGDIYGVWKVKFANVTFTEDPIDRYIYGCDFTGSKGANINIPTLAAIDIDMLSYNNFRDARIFGVITKEMEAKLTQKDGAINDCITEEEYERRKCEQELADENAIKSCLEKIKKIGKNERKYV